MYIIRLLNILNEMFFVFVLNNLYIFIFLVCCFSLFVYFVIIGFFFICLFCIFIHIIVFCFSFF